MMRIPYDKLVAKIKESTNISDAEINSKIKEKMSQLSGLISKEGAAHIVANELGVKLLGETEGKLKIKDIYAGMRSVETVGKITNIYELKEFPRQDGSTGKVASFVMGDETSSLRVVLWNDQTDKLKELGVGKVIHITGGYTKENMNGNIELHIATKANIKVMEGENIENVAALAKPQRKRIDALNDADINVELFATIVQVFEPRFYEVCPECNKRAKQKETGFECSVHGNINPAFSSMLTLILDDGSSTIRTVFFKNQAANLLKIGPDDLLKLKDIPSEYDSIKEKLLGNQIRVIGRVSKNEMFNRLEFISQLVFPEPDADEELKRLEKEAEAIE
jgi:hypothetical protein